MRFWIFLFFAAPCLAQEAMVASWYSSVQAPEYAFAIDTGTVEFVGTDVQKIISIPGLKKGETWVTFTQGTEGTTADRVGYACEVNDDYIRFMRDTYSVGDFSDGMLRYQVTRSTSSHWEVIHLKIPGLNATGQHRGYLGKTIDTTHAWVTVYEKTEQGEYYGEWTVGTRKLFPTTDSVAFNFVQDLETADTLFVQVVRHDSVDVVRNYVWNPMNIGTSSYNITTATCNDTTKEGLLVLYTGQVSNALQYTDSATAMRVTVERTNSTTVAAKRDHSDKVDIENLCLQRLTFIDGTTVRRIYRSYGTSENKVNLSHPQVDWTRTVITTPSMYYGLGRAPAYSTTGGKYWGTSAFALRPMTSTTTEGWRLVGGAITPSGRTAFLIVTLMELGMYK